MNPRLLAVRILLQILVEGKSLNACAIQFNEKIEDAKDRAFARELCFGILRWYPKLRYIIAELLTKSLKAKDKDIECVLLIGIYQILFMRVPDHAAVSESVKLTQKLSKGWAKSLVNGVLRQLLRDQEKILETINTNEEAKYAHPNWFIDKLKNDWPEDWESILEANNQHAPMVLRVNQQKISKADYLLELNNAGIEAVAPSSAADALMLGKPCDVTLLPQFKDGAVSVQDMAAQQAAYLLNLEEGMRVLDACAAPGGKTAHILEVAPKSHVVALDVSEDRAELVRQTLTRLHSKAEVISTDAAEVESWWDGQLFDRVLLDAPCSATGVIRRNPDIKFHRTLEDVLQVVHNQRNLLEKLWQVLKPGGILLYATCSVLKDENESQILNFLASYDDAKELEFESDWGVRERVGKQIFPGDSDMDGFYYARIQKTE